jgi:hypothetical protein
MAGLVIWKRQFSGMAAKGNTHEISTEDSAERIEEQC